MPTTLVPTLLAHAGHADHVGGTHVPVPLFVALAVVIGGLLPARARDGLTGAVVLCSAAAGAIHAAVTPDHFTESAVFGLFFLAVTLGQLVVVVAALHRPSRWLWSAAAAGNAAVLAVWGLSRTAGVPFGPHPWTAEPAGLLDLACAAYEVAIVASCLCLRRNTRPAPAAARRVAAATPAVSVAG